MHVLCVAQHQSILRYLISGTNHLIIQTLEFFFVYHQEEM